MSTGTLTRPALALCFTVLAAISASCFPLERKGAGGAKDTRGQFASWDDVNVLAHGLLQLGQGLKEHVDRTKGQVRDIAARLRAFDGTVAELGRQTQRLERDGVALRGGAGVLREREERVLNASAQLRQHAEELRRESQRFGDRVARLEEKVDGMLQREDMGVANGNYSDHRTIQWMLETQNKRIDDLVERIRQQQEKLEKQNVRIRTLKNQIQLRKARPFLRRKAEEDTQNDSTEQSDPPLKVASDCHQLFLGGERSSGVYTLQPAGSQPFQVFCEMTSEGGWTVIQRRQDGSVDFDQQWQAYRNGFGNLKGEFWLGLEKTHSIIKDREYVLQVALSDWRDAAQSIRYVFRLDGEEKAYALHLQDTTIGGLGSALSTEPSGLLFSTRDHDNDQKADSNCAKLLSGGWWFGSCEHSNLNGRYVPGQPSKPRHQWKQGMFWKTWRGRYHPLKTTVMKIAPAEIQHSS
ncbi:angiopoietin-related protein 4-like [Anguilla anguilla]|uniref:angiopoietin-related protein 4-like n=1 Tax=Anguilla anguilla TaxID=7936 RepID=UPI0015B20D08|nr:angiopoietin-related protein 4-like [Anguilla anguilla]